MKPQEYTRLAAMLQALATRQSRELPPGTASLSLRLSGDKLIVEAFDASGKLLGTIPNGKTSELFAYDLDRTFQMEMLKAGPIRASVSDGRSSAN